MRKLLSVLVSAILLMSCDQPTSPVNSTGPIETKIANIRIGTIATGTEVAINGVIVTSTVGLGGRGFFVQDEVATSNGGIMIYVKNNAGLVVAIGDKVSITGIYQEYFTQSQIAVENVHNIVKNGTDSTPPPIISTISELASGSNIEKYESMLIKIENVNVTEVNTSEKTWVLDNYLVVDDYFYSPTDFPAVDDTFSSIVGVVYYSYDKYRLEPRSASDVIK